MYVVFSYENDGSPLGEFETLAEAEVFISQQPNSQTCWTRFC